MMALDGNFMRPSDHDHLAWMLQHRVDVKGKIVVDLGCGSGALCQALRQQGAFQALGVDIELPRQLKGHPDYWEGDLDQEELWQSLAPIKPQVICAFDIIEHLIAPWLFTGRLSKILPIGGVLVLTTANTQSWERLLKPKTWSGASDPQHKTLFSPYSLKFMLEKQGFALDVMAAPIRSLRGFQRILPLWGGQLFVIARKVSNPSS